VSIGTHTGWLVIVCFVMTMAGCAYALAAAALPIGAQVEIEAWAYKPE